VVLRCVVNLTIKTYNPPNLFGKPKPNLFIEFTLPKMAGIQPFIQLLWMGSQFQGRFMNYRWNSMSI
jgi:hypothetical protein